MGLYDRIKRSVMAITGRDPESSADGSLFRYANRKDSLAAQIGTTPFDHFGFQPDQLPPGWAFNQAGKIYPVVRDVATTTPTVALQTEIWDASSSSRAPLSLLRFANWMRLEGSDGAGTLVAEASSTPPWKVLYKTITLTAGAATDQELVAVVTGKKFDVAILAVDVLPEVAASPTTISLVWQDSDNAAVTGHLGIKLRYMFAAAAVAMPPVAWRGSFGAQRFITPTATKALEVDVSGGVGTEVVEIFGLYRQV